MPKYLVEARYTTEGAKGLAREGGSGRREAVQKTLKSVGGKLEAFYYAFGGVDALTLCSMFPITHLQPPCPSRQTKAARLQARPSCS